ncbi:MAG: hypothetical protein QF629_05415 [Alphaproteobacteria bacterium]|nr:hypothetical protein [Alphaproteobacteria bacterium]MDP6237386.1 hypothetical protein [Alphaproteobacteria bacterium]HJN22089.1 hypothetical protein [Alphaproteobacteria bacterium]
MESYDFAKSGLESLAYCHINLIVRRCSYNFENLNLDCMSEAGAHEFLFSWLPIKLVGGTGAPDTPNPGLLGEQYLMNKGSPFTFPFLALDEPG